MRRSRMVVVLGVALALVPGCKKASESSAERAAERAIQQATGNKAEVDLSGAGVKITGKEGGKEFSYEAAGKGRISLPKDFPDDVPQYPGALVLASMSQGNEMTVVTLQTGDAAEKVSGYYGAELKAAGWDIVNQISTPQMHMVSGKKSGRSADVTVVGGGDGKCTISVVYNKAKS